MVTGLVRRNAEFADLDHLVRGFFSEPQWTAGACCEEGTLPLDVSEDEKSVIVRASLPGFSREQVTVEVHDGVLTIKAAHKDEKEESGERYYRRERSFRSMSRRVALPGAVEENGAQGELKDGVLTLRIPKTRPVTPRRVEIQ